MMATSGNTNEGAHASLRRLLTAQPVLLAPMEEVTGPIFRRICRQLGADLCVTEFVNVEGLLRGCRRAARKISLEPDDQPTGIQIYGGDAGRLAEAAASAEQARPAFIDINCGCWVPKIARRGAGAGWLRRPDEMVQMVRQVVAAVSLPVTVKTRIGVGTEEQMPIIDLARRLEDAGAAALTLHCRTAKAGLKGEADWSWAAHVRERVRFPVIVNGDIKSAGDARRALDLTGCAGVMVGRRAIEHPWVFREIHALLDRGETPTPPTTAERFGLCREHLRQNVMERGEHRGVRSARRHLGGYLLGLRGASALRMRLFQCDSLAGCLEILEDAERRLAAAPFPSVASASGP